MDQAEQLLAGIESNLALATEEGNLLAMEAAAGLLGISDAPQAANAVYAAAIAGETTGDLSPSLALYRALTNLPRAEESLKAIVWYRMALCFDRLGNWNQSIVCLRRALAHSAHSAYVKAAAGYRLGLLLGVSEEHEEAADLLDLARFVEDHPEVDPLRAALELGCCLTRLGRLDEAETLLREVTPACDHDPALSVHVRLLRVDVYRAAGNTAAMRAPLLELATTHFADPGFRAMAYEKLQTLHEDASDLPPIGRAAATA